jgi:hypothetical protein
VLVDFDVTGVDHEPLYIRDIYEQFRKPFPVSAVAPSAKPAVHVFPVPVVRRQISPGCPGAQYPKDSVYEPAIILCIATPGALTPLQVRFELFPEMIRDVMAMVSLLT